MAKWTKRNNPHVWKRAATKKRRRKAKPVAKKKRRSPRRGSSRRRRGRGGGSGKSFSQNDVMWGVGFAGLYGLASNHAEQNAGAVRDALQKMPVLTPVGRAGTIALAALAAWKGFKVWPKWTKRIALGMGAVAAVNLGRRGGLYENEQEARALMTAGEDGGGGEYLEGDVDLEGDDIIEVEGDEYVDAA